MLTPTRVVRDEPAGHGRAPVEGARRRRDLRDDASGTARPRTCSGSPPPTRRPRCGRAASASGRLNRRVTDYEVSFGADSFAGTGEDVASAIRRYIHDRDRRRRIGSQEELAGLHRLLDLAGRT